MENQRGWNIALPNALWVDRVTPKHSLEVSPYTLVYGKEAIFPLNILLPASQLAQALRGSSSEVLQVRINTLLKLEDSRLKAKERFKHQQEIVKKWFNKRKSGNRIFEVQDMVIKWDHLHDEKGKHTKFQHLWIGPFHIAAKLGPSMYKLQDL